MKINSSIKRKLKRGSLGLAMTIAVIALIIGINYLITSLESSVSTQINLDDKGYYDISDASHTAFAALPEGSFDAQIIFLTQRDILASTSNESIRMIWNLAEEYGRQFPDNISVIYKDLDKDVAFVKQYMNETRTTLSKTQVIIQGKYHARVLSFNAFFTTDQSTGSIATFRGELRFTAAILQSCMEKQPLALFSVNHGETFMSTVSSSGIDIKGFDKDDDTLKESYITSVPLLEILSVAGFDVGTIDLSKEEIPEDATALFISSPITDLEGIDPANPNGRTEADKISEFVDKYNSLVVIVGKDTPALPNLSELLWEEYNMGYEAGEVIADMSNSVAGGDGNTVGEDYTYDGFSVLGQFSGADNSFASSIYNSLSSSYKFVFRNAVRLKQNDDRGGDEASISTFSTAKAYANGKEVAKGEFPLLLSYATSNDAKADYSTGIGEATLYKKVFLISSSEFLTPEFASVSYGNRELLLGMSRVMISEQKYAKGIGEINVVVEDKTLSAEKLTSGQAYRYLRISVIWLPLAIMAAGLIVWLKRRHA